jgi:SET domain-containing protein
MILVKVKIKESPIHGVGLFSDQIVRKNRPVWEASPLLDQHISWLRYSRLSPREKKFVGMYAIWQKNFIELSFDHSRFINHSAKRANVRYHLATHTLRSLREIGCGEEILQDYSEFWPECDLPDA